MECRKGKVMSENLKVYTVEDLTEMLGTSKNAVYCLLKKNYFRSIKIGGLYRIPKKGFDDWLEGKPEDGAQEVFEEEVEDPLADDRYLDGDLEREQAEKKQEETQAQPKKDLSQMSTEELMKEFMEAWEKSSDQPTKKPKCL